jgi:outer membrane lipoprotein carrier protein
MPGSLTCLLSYGLVCGAPEAAPEPELDPTAPTDPADPDKPEGPASAVLAKVQSFYDGTTDFRATFTQTYTQTVYGTKTTSKGKLRVKKPGMMVWDYDKTDNPDFWVDNDLVWVVERDTKQVIKRNIGGSDFAGAEKFLFGGEKLIDEFLVRPAKGKSAEKIAMPGHTVIELKPKKENPHYKMLRLVVDDKTGRVDAFVILNSDESTNHFVLEGYERNVGQDAADFKFVKPKDFVEIRE